MAEKKLSKQQRQHCITKLLEEHGITSQSQIVDYLIAEGISATQTTVSRDLEEMGAIKVRAPGGLSIYAIPELPNHQFTPPEHLKRVMSEWVVEVGSSANIVVLRTPPGSAHVVASALDRAGVTGMLGTVAGDDTLMVVADAATSGTALAEQLREIAGL